MMIYIHIPFCRNKCFYCGFYSTVSRTTEDDFLKALSLEMKSRKNYIDVRPVQTLYIGGGTPSCLSIEKIGKIVREAEENYVLLPGAERTFEMNPEDMHMEKLQALKESGFNRLSVGVQSFDDDLLKKINRTHTGKEAITAIEQAQKAGFENISIDFILGLPGQLRTGIENDIKQAIRLCIPHISIYMLSIDPGSIFQKNFEKRKIELPEDDEMAESYLFLSEMLQIAGFEHYEISNFAKGGNYSKHNTGYWQQKPYIGFGPSAHSYDGNSRQWNVSNIKTYIEKVKANEDYFEREELSGEDRYNEYIMTSLRTKWGADKRVLENVYGHFWQQNSQKVERYIKDKLLYIKDDQFILTEKGRLLSDYIFSELFVLSFE